MSSYSNVNMSFTTQLLPAMTHQFGIIRGIHPLPIKQEPTALQRLALALAEGIHQLLQLRCALDLEEDFVVVVRHFDVEVF